MDQNFRNGGINMEITEDKIVYGIKGLQQPLHFSIKINLIVNNICPIKRLDDVFYKCYNIK